MLPLDYRAPLLFSTDCNANGTTTTFTTTGQPLIIDCLFHTRYCNSHHRYNRPERGTSIVCLHNNFLVLYIFLSKSSLEGQLGSGYALWGSVWSRLNIVMVDYGQVKCHEVSLELVLGLVS